MKLLTQFVGFPFIFTNHRQVINWTAPIDDWNIESVPRSITPHLNPKNNFNRTNNFLLNDDNEIIKRIENLKNSISGRTVTINYNTDNNLFSPLLNTAVKLISFNLIADEIESSFSCSSCKAGNKY